MFSSQPNIQGGKIIITEIVKSGLGGFRVAPILLANPTVFSLYTLENNIVCATGSSWEPVTGSTSFSFTSTITTS